jgi:hypothetical protein
VVGIDLLVEGDNAQDRSVWITIQTWLESNCTSFIDHVNGPLNAGKTAPLYFTKTTWQAAADLNVSAVAGESFKRKVELSDGWSYGFLAIGDIRGDWCFEDLQKGLSMLKGTVWGVLSTADTERRTALGSGWYYKGCDYARNMEIENWATASYESYAGYGYMALGGKNWSGIYGMYYFRGTRDRGKLVITMTMDLDSSCDVYYLVSAATDCAFYNVDGLDVVENQYYKWGNAIPITANSVYTSGYLADESTNPVEVIPITCPMSSYDFKGIKFGTTPLVIANWDFTYN